MTYALIYIAIGAVAGIAFGRVTLTNPSEMPDDLDRDTSYSANGVRDCSDLAAGDSCYS